MQLSEGIHLCVHMYMFQLVFTNNGGIPSIQYSAGVETASGGVNHAGVATSALEPNWPDVALIVKGRVISNHLREGTHTHTHTHTQ